MAMDNGLINEFVTYVKIWIWDTYWNEKMLIGMARNDPKCHGLTRPFPVQTHGLIRIRRGTVPDRFFFVKPSLRISRWFILGDETNSGSMVPGDPTCRPSVEEWWFQRKKSLGNQVVKIIAYYPLVSHQCHHCHHLLVGKNTIFGSIYPLVI